MKRLLFLFVLVAPCHAQVLFKILPTPIGDDGKPKNYTPMLREDGSEVPLKIITPQSAKNLNSLLQISFSRPYPRRWLLNLPGIADDLRLTERQQEQIAEIRCREPGVLQREELGDVNVFDLSQSDLEVYAHEVRKAQQLEYKMADTALDEVLTKAQAERLKQIEFQYHISAYPNIKKAFAVFNEKCDDPKAVELAERELRAIKMMATQLFEARKRDAMEEALRRVYGDRSMNRLMGERFHFAEEGSFDFSILTKHGDVTFGRSSSEDSDFRPRRSSRKVFISPVPKRVK